MRFSNLAAGFLCAVSLVVAGQARAQTAKDVFVTNSELAVDVINTLPIAVDVGPDAILVDVANTTPIPVDVGEPVQVEGAHSDHALRVHDQGIFAPQLIMSGVFTLDASTTNGSETTFIPQSSVWVVKTISVHVNKIGDEATVRLIFHYKDDPMDGFLNELYIPLIDQGNGDWSNTISVTVPVRAEAEFAATLIGNVTSANAVAHFTVSGYQAFVGSP